jgi:apolipoprotein N-acyltransferase
LIIINECIALAITQRHESRFALAKPLLMAASIIVMMSGYGNYRLQNSTTHSQAPVSALRIGMVQANIFDYEHLRQKMGAYDVVRHVLDTHFAMSREAIDQHHVDALLWSETVYPTTFAKPKSESGAELDREILDFVTAAKVPLVFGTYDRDGQGEYNAAAFVEPNSGLLGFYRKTDLFFLTEYVPDWLDGPLLRAWLPWAGTWKRGDGARLFPLRLADGREIPAMSMICLDDVNTQLAIEGARLGAQVILSMSNDSWFTQYPVGANLHLHVAAFRSIETRLPQVRVTANGVSAVIDATGSIATNTAMSEEKLLIGEVSVREPPMTLMVAWGDWVGRAGFLALMLLLGVSLMSSLNRRAAGRIKNASTRILSENFHAEALVLTRFWRSLAGLLRITTCGGLLFMGFTVLFGDEAQRNAFTQIWLFVALVLVPETATWCIRRAFSAKLHFEDGMLVLQQGQRRIDIQIKNIAAINVWTLPLPDTGVNLRLSTGQDWSYGIALADVAGLIQALIHAGGSPVFANSLSHLVAIYADARQAVPRRWYEHLVIKLVLFPLVPALPAFRLHQHIAYGGTFGEYQTFGLKAYLLAFFIWWASWIIGMVLFAALLRIIIEAGTVFSILIRTKQALDIRRSLELLGHLLFYMGVPIWLGIKMWP